MESKLYQFSSNVGNEYVEKMDKMGGTWTYLGEKTKNTIQKWLAEKTTDNLEITTSVVSMYATFDYQDYVSKQNPSMAIIAKISAEDNEKVIQSVLKSLAKKM